MPEDFSNIGDGGLQAAGPDGHGKAALLLVESLIHGLIERRSLTVAQAIEVIEVAADAEGEINLAAGAGARFVPPSLLAPIAASLRFEGER